MHLLNQLAKSHKKSFSKPIPLNISHFLSNTFYKSCIHKYVHTNSLNQELTDTHHGPKISRNHSQTPLRGRDMVLPSLVLKVF